MPKMDGFELYDRIRQKDQNTKICFLTASEMFCESLRQARNLLGKVLGEEHFIQKPAKTDQLIRRITDLINWFRCLSPERLPLSAGTIQ
jgi:CheY-like chemotaxis protein